MKGKKKSTERETRSETEKERLQFLNPDSSVIAVSALGGILPGQSPRQMCNILPAETKTPSPQSLSPFHSPQKGKSLST